MQVDTVKKQINKWKTEREKHFFSSLPLFASFYQESRHFYLSLSTISATIGAFSFLFFDSSQLQNRQFLIYADLLLLLVIGLAMCIYLWEISKEHTDFHNTYYSLFERLNRDIDKGEKFISHEITQQEYVDKLRIEIEKMETYKRPGSPNYIYQIVLIEIFVFALFSLFLSFTDINYFPL